ncbi:MAG: GTPase [Clostridia bacterium]|nr:GTPase [Clostridia bacterium]
MSKPVVAIVGRPNVGKSTLFNRITGGRVAIVENTPGVTRDRLYREAEWRGRKFMLVDTGGFALGEDTLTASVRRQAEIALQEADVVLFLVDTRTGITADDWAVAEMLRRSQAPVILVANKIEDFRDESLLHEFYRLGLGEPFPISAAHGLNVGDLLDLVVELLPPAGEEESVEAVKIAVVGRPNVGKSSLVNKILGQERVIVSEEPGTTRDAIDTYFNLRGKEYILIDTAGMRRKSRVDTPIEKYSVLRAMNAVRRADVALVLLDGVEGVTEQDKKIAGFCHDEGKASILIVNKWDLVPKDSRTADRYLEALRYELAFISYAPVLFISALTGQRVPRVLETVDVVAAEARKRVATGPLNDLIQEAVLRNPPPFKVYYVTQVRAAPPTFLFFVDRPDEVHFSFRRYFENQLREAYGFTGNPIRIIFRRGRK